MFSTMNKDVPKIFLFTSFLFMLIVILFLSVSVCRLKNKENNVVYVDKIIRDTTYLTIRDTMKITKFVTLEKEVKDTVYIVVKDSIKVPVPMYDYNFKEEGVYDIDVYGYNVKLNKVELYPQTKIVTITQTVEKIAQEGWDCYLRGGFGAFNGGIVPKVGFMLKAPNRVSFGGNIGYYNNNLAFDIEVGYKIF